MTRKNKSINFKISEKIYPLEVVFLACYTYIDKVYIYLDQAKAGEFEITMIAKDGVGADSMKEIAGEFHNELLFSALRQKISKSNKRLREAIVFSALFSAQGNDPESLIDKGMGEGIGLDNDNDVDDDAWKDDPLGIAVSWEEKQEMKGDDRKIEKKKIVKNEAKSAPANKKKKK